MRAAARDEHCLRVHATPRVGSFLLTLMRLEAAWSGSTEAR